MAIIKKMFSRKKRKKIILCVVFVIILCVTLFQTGFTTNLCGREPVDISCHYLRVNDTLAAIESFSPLPRSIFFHETSCNGNLTSRQSCAIESAARSHTNWQIYVLFSGSIPLNVVNSKHFLIFKEYKNVHFARVLIKEYSKGTPLQHFIESNPLKMSLWKIEQTSDLLKYITLYKWGGIAMDLDLIVTKTLGSLARNWAARESDNAIASGILAFSKDNVGKKFAEEAMSGLLEIDVCQVTPESIGSKLIVCRDIKLNFKEDDMFRDRSRVISRVLKSLCSTTEPRSMSATTCDGFEIYGPQFFYQVDRLHAREYFERKQPRVDYDNVYTYHFWGHITKKYKVMNGSPYSRLAERYCPSTYNLYGNDFGE